MGYLREVAKEQKRMLSSWARVLDFVVDAPNENGVGSIVYDGNDRMYQVVWQDPHNHGVNGQRRLVWLMDRRGRVDAVHEETLRIKGYYTIY